MVKTEMAGRVGSRGLLSGLALLGFAVCLLLLVTGLPFRIPDRIPRVSNDERPSIVILSLDTLRADHLSSYGYWRPTSPRLDAFAAESVRFDEALAQATGTLPSHLSLLTSLNPPQFRITRNDGKNTNQPSTSLRLPDAVTTLADVLGNLGYETAAFTDGGIMSARFGFAQGFDTFHVNRRREGLRGTLPELRRFLERRSGRPAGGNEPGPRPVFLFIHTYDIHEPYDAPDPFSRAFSEESFEEMSQSLRFKPVTRMLNRHRSKLTPRQRAEVTALYDNGIAWADDRVAALLELLRAHGHYEDAVIIVLSDHGEEFLDHGGFGHGRTVYQEQVRVPLMIRLPGGHHAGRVVDEPVALIDVAPTALELAGLPPVPEFEGMSLVGLIQNSDAGHWLEERPVYFESPNAAKGPHGLRRGRWKLIRNDSRGTTELYDVSADPEERLNLAEQAVGVRSELSQQLLTWVAEMEESGRQQGWFAVPGPPRHGVQRAGPGSSQRHGHALDLSEEERETLRELGYLD